MPIVSISIPDKLLKKIDTSIKEKGFASRSEIIRQAFRAYMIEYKNLRELEGEIISTITILFKKGVNRDKMFATQHEYGHVISTFLHSHVDENYCLEVIVATGDVNVIRKLVEDLKANEQIAQVKITVLEKL